MKFTIPSRAQGTADRYLIRVYLFTLITLVLTGTPSRAGLKPIAQMKVVPPCLSRDQKLKEPAPVPERFSGTKREELLLGSTALNDERRRLENEWVEHDKKCGSVPASDTVLVNKCLSRRSEILEEMEDYCSRLETFKRAVWLAEITGEFTKNKGGASRGAAGHARQSASTDTVDLTFMDPDEPLVVDPRVVKGALSAEEAKQMRAEKFLAGSYMRLSRHYARSGNYDEAINLLKKVQAVRPDDRNVAVKLKELSGLRKRAQNPSDPRAGTEALLDALGKYPGDWEASISYLAGILEKDPGNEPVREALHFARGLYAGMQWHEQKEIERMNGELLEIIFDDDDWKKPLANKSLAEARQKIMNGKYGAALADLEDAREIYPGDLGIQSMIDITEGLWAQEDFGAWLLHVSFTEGVKEFEEKERP